jgi:radical SAM protein with 4Fe4S-binding SPASM domain
MEAVLPSSKQYQRQKRGKKNKFDIERFDAIEACHFCCHLPLCGSLCRRSFGSTLEQLHWMMLVQPLAENPQYYY